MAEIVSCAEVLHVMHALGGCEAAVGWIASRQLALITREQLEAAGLGRGTVSRRTSAGSLHRMYRGVYLVGHPVPLPGARELGAVLACGAGALVSGRSAAALWGLTESRPGPVDVTVVGRHCRSRPNLRVHLVDELDRRDQHHRRGIPSTSPARALVELAAEAADDDLEAALSEARALRLIQHGDLEAALDRAGCRAGVARMRRLLRIEGDRGYTRSKAERVMRKLMRDAGLPQPVCNHRLHGYGVDFLWPDARLVVEVDGYQFHGHRSAFERDRRKEQVLTAAGYTVIHITWLQLVHEPLRVAAVVAATLAANRVPT